MEEYKFLVVGMLDETWDLGPDFSAWAPIDASMYGELI